MPTSGPISVLQGVKAISGSCDLVFPSPFYPGKPLSDGTLSSALARMGYKGLATAHGFRTLFSSAANEAGWLDGRATLMQWWADRIDEPRKGADVIPFKAA